MLLSEDAAALLNDTFKIDALKGGLRDRDLDDHGRRLTNACGPTAAGSQRRSGVGPRDGLAPSVVVGGLRAWPADGTVEPGCRAR